MDDGGNNGMCVYISSNENDIYKEAARIRSCERNMNDTIEYIPIDFIPGSRPITYNEVLNTLSEQMSDTFMWLSVILLSYVLMNMYVFNENARFRKFLDVLDEEKYQIQSVGSVKAIIVQIVQTGALFSALMLVIMNLTYRMGLNI